MTRVTPMRPPYQKEGKGKTPRKGLKPVSDKRRAYRASQEGQGDLAYLRAVKSLPCVICGAPAPSDAHHCTHRPDGDGYSPYMREPSAGRKSHDMDTIPLCKRHHQNGPEAIHNGKETWRRKNGADYLYIPQTRARVAAMLDEIDF